MFAFENYRVSSSAQSSLDDISKHGDASVPAQKY
jgi:hypothetical protein